MPSFHPLYRPIRRLHFVRPAERTIAACPDCALRWQSPARTARAGKSRLSALILRLVRVLRSSKPDYFVWPVRMNHEGGAALQ